jgi:hypothetical protein
MKLSKLIVFLALVAAATLGHVNGKSTSQAALADACQTRAFAVIYDADTREPRHFHCFEVQLQAQPDPPKAEAVRNLLHL